MCVQLYTYFCDFMCLFLGWGWLSKTYVCAAPAAVNMLSSMDLSSYREFHPNPVGFDLFEKAPHRGKILTFENHVGQKNRTYLKTWWWLSHSTVLFVFWFYAWGTNLLFVPCLSLHCILAPVVEKSLTKTFLQGIWVRTRPAGCFETFKLFGHHQVNKHGYIHDIYIIYIIHTYNSIINMNYI